MRRVPGVIRAELKLQVRDYTYWAVLVLWQVIVVFALVENAEFPPGMRTWSVTGALLPVSGAAAALHFASILAREGAAGALDLVDALPHRAQELVWGKLLAGLTLWVLPGLEVVLILAWLWVRGGAPLAAFTPAAALMGAVYFVTAVSAAGVGLIAAAVFRRARVAYVFAAGVWVGLVVVAPVSLLQAVDPLRLRWLEFLLPPGTVVGWSETWGVFPDGPLVWRQVLWHLGLGAGLASLAALLYRRWRDPDARRRFSTGVLVAALVLATLGAGGYVSVFQDRLARAERQSTVYGESRVPDPDQETRGPLRGTTVVDDYSLRVRLGPGHRLSVDGTLRVRNGGAVPLSEVRLTLNNELTVERVAVETSPMQLPGAAPAAEVQRSGDHVTIMLEDPLPPGGEAVLSLSYGGEMWIWDPALNWGLGLAGGGAGGGVWLPATICWYPAPGHQTLAYRVDIAYGATVQGWTLERSAPRYDLASYRLTFEVPEALDLGTSLGPAVTPPEGTAARPPEQGRRLLYVEGRAWTDEGVLVLGAQDLQVTDGEAGPVITSPALADAGLAASAEARLLLDFFSGLFPVPGPAELVLIAKPDRLGRGSGFFPPGDGEGLVLPEATLASSSLGRLAFGDLGDIPGHAFSLLRDVSGGAKDVTSPWFGREVPEWFASPEVRRALAVKSAFRSFCRALAVGEVHGPADYEVMLAVERQLGGRGEDEDWEAVLGALDRLYRERGLGAVKELLTEVWSPLSAAELQPEAALELTSSALAGDSGE